MPRLFCLLLCPVLIGLSCAPAAGQTLVDPPERPGRIVEIEQHAGGRIWSAWLDNGVRIHAIELPGDAPEDAAGVAVVIAGGPLFETHNTHGSAGALAEIFERPALPGLDAAGSAPIIRSAGLELGAALRPDAIILTVRCDRSALDDAAGLLRYTLNRPAIEPAGLIAWIEEELIELDEERPDVRIELMRALRSSLLPPGDPRATLPDEDDLRRLSPELIAGFYEQHVRRAPMAVAVASRAPAPETIERFARQFGALAPRDRIERLYAPEHRVQAVGGRRVVSKALGPEPGVGGVLIAIPAPTGEDVGDLRAALLGRIILGDRIEAAGTDGRAAPWAEARAVLWPGFAHPGAGYFGLLARVEPGAEAEARRLLFAEIRNLAETPPTEAELAGALGRLTSQIERSRGDPLGWAIRAADTDYRGLDPADGFALAEKYAAIKPRDIAAMAQRLLDTGEIYEVLLRSPDPD